MWCLAARPRTFPLTLAVLLVAPCSTGLAVSATGAGGAGGPSGAHDDA